MQKYSAILEMHRGNRGDGQKIQYGEEYWKRAHEYATLAEAFQEKLKKFPDLLKEWEACEWASMGTEAAAEEEQYREGFSFGLLMGLEIGMYAMKSKNGE